MLLTLLLSAMLGHWLTDADRLPAFSYDAPLPFECTTPDGKTPQMRNDPWFLLGNYRIKVFVHVDGTYELISGSIVGLPDQSWDYFENPSIAPIPTPGCCIVIIK